ncbi:spondin-1 [Epargyreus clarus]|uniref:spondin-1 n=1 Tax=Epargyreus clarus TaxID=520877 RepID=UPI003C2B737A
MLVALCVALVASRALACELAPGDGAGPKAPGDNFYRLILNGEVERYAPGQRYVVTLVGSRTHDVVQQFTRFELALQPLDPAAPRSPRAQGHFQLFADTLSKFHDECTNTVVEADTLPKTEVQVMWKAPPAGSGCVLIKAMVFESASRWFAEDGQLTRRVCEDTALAAPDCCACDDAKYKLVFEGLWSPQTHPKDFPTQALWLTHFSDIIGASHPKNFSFWGEGQIATDGFRSLAEWGSVGLLERELRQRGGLRSIVKAQGLWYPHVNSNTSTAFSVDKKRPYLSVASMFGPSPDWVVGVNGLNLCNKDCSWAREKIVDLYPYDAGTDNGISYMSPNSESVPRERMYRITSMYPEDPRAPFYSADGAPLAPLARLHVVRDRVIPRGCDEDTLLALVAEEAENTQNTNKPECAVSEWGAWSACSVSCGKGLRMRTREYRMPQKAQMFACDRQLVSKEMCVAAVAECEDDSVTEVEEAAPVVEEGMCGTSEWGGWSECSVTCGVGVETRRRHFLHPMGFKKCPLVQIEENRKCMQPECSEAEREVADPECPTTEWAGWSPCSASCGRGVSFRTRLLLVPAAQQQPCSARVELLQQRPCQERDSCEIDMQTAKRICMEEAEQGPCRGRYARWSFVAAKGMCVQFHYGGCRGNRNNFLTQQDCLDTCSVVLGGGAGGAGGPPSASSNYPGLSISSIVPVPANGGAGRAAECQLSAWGDWSACSAQCGAGYQQRTRTVLAEAGPGAAPCSARVLRRRRRCFRAC